MKFCKNCGTQVADDAMFCTNCGTQLAQPDQQQFYAAPQPARKPSGLAVAAKVLMIISTVATGLYLIPLAWCLPMTISYSKKIKNGEPVSIDFKICTLLFVNTISGILMLCDGDN